MKKLNPSRVVVALALAMAMAFPAMSAELNFCPQTWTKINVDGSSVLFVWGIPGLTPKPLVANPDYTWPTEAAVYAWWQVFRQARIDGTCVTIYYNPVATAQGFDLWSVSE